MTVPDSKLESKPDFAPASMSASKRNSVTTLLPNSCAESPNLLSQFGDVRYCAGLFSKDQSDRFLRELQADIAWKHESITIFGKRVLQPRLTAFYGDSDREYRYSGITMKPALWTNTLLEIKRQIEDEFALKFNSALLNCYRNGEDSMGWHRDDEKELGKNPVIGSVSFGETRALQFKLVENKAIKSCVDLEHGSFLLMQGTTQHHWYHGIMKTKKVKGPRINITFRNII